MNKSLKTLIILGLFSLSLGMARPANAFYIEVPKFFKDAYYALRLYSTKAQEASGTVSPAPVEPAPAPATSVSEPNQPTTNQTTPTEPPPQPQPVPPQPTCRVNGVDMPGACDQYPAKDNMSEPNAGPQNPQDNQDQERYIKDMKRGAMQMERQLNRLQRDLGKLSDSDAEKLKALKEKITLIKNASSADVLQEIDMGEINEETQYFERMREATQRLKQIQRDIRGPQNGLKMFKKQVTALKKKNLALPEGLEEKIATLEKTFVEIKNIKTLEDLENYDFDVVQDLMQELDEHRQTLEWLMRKPEMDRRIKQEIRRLTQALNQDLKMAARLKERLDITAKVDELKNWKDRLETAVKEANALMPSDPQAGFEKIESDFFEQLSEFWQLHENIQQIGNMISNLKRFKAEFNREITNFQREIKRLKQKKHDVTQLEDTVKQAKNKASQLFKTSDEEEMMTLFDELEGLKEEADDIMNDLTGKKEETGEMIWKKEGTEQFKRVEMSPSIKRYITKEKPAEPAQRPNNEIQPAPEAMPPEA